VSVFPPRDPDRVREAILIVTRARANDWCVARDERAFRTDVFQTAVTGSPRGGQ